KFIGRFGLNPTEFFNRKPNRPSRFSYFLIRNRPFKKKTAQIERFKLNWAVSTVLRFF
ncbi:LOW QUALITY PROTEIN: hypothetical protein TorRG33x02_325400, partial [Trema orientale]